MYHGEGGGTEAWLERWSNVRFVMILPIQQFRIAIALAVTSRMQNA